MLQVFTAIFDLLKLKDAEMKGCKRDDNPRPCRWQSKRRTNDDGQENPQYLIK